MSAKPTLKTRIYSGQSLPLLGAAILGLTPTGLQATGNVFNGSTSNDYNTASKWNGGGGFPAEVPGTTDTASSPRVNGGSSVSLSSSVPDVQQVYLGLGGSGAVDFNVGSGASLTSNNGFFLGWGGSVGTVTYNQTSVHAVTQAVVGLGLAFTPSHDVFTSKASVAA